MGFDGAFPVYTALPPEKPHIEDNPFGLRPGFLQHHLRGDIILHPIRQPYPQTV
jgi:hypothetical protein